MFNKGELENDLYHSKKKELLCLNSLQRSVGLLNGPGTWLLNSGFYFASTKPFLNSFLQRAEAEMNEMQNRTMINTFPFLSKTGFGIGSCWRVLGESLLLISWAKFQTPVHFREEWEGDLHVWPHAEAPALEHKNSWVVGITQCRDQQFPNRSRPWQSSAPCCCHSGCFYASDCCVLLSALQVTLTTACSSMRSPPLAKASWPIQMSMKATQTTQVRRSHSLCCPLSSEGN